MYRFFYLILLMSVCVFAQTYYYSNGQKTLLEEKKSLSRDMSEHTCYSHNSIDDEICLNNEIIISINEIYLDDILTKYNLQLTKKLLDNLFLVQTSDYKETLNIANDIHIEKNVKYAYPNFNSVVKFRNDTEPLVLSDPYGASAWHLKNTGQGQNYKHGADIKIQRAWLNNRGLGIKIGIIDDGIEISHPDVVYTDGYSVTNPAARNPDHHASNTAHHGTKAASLIVGKNNNIGSIGVAPESLLYVVNVDGSPKVSDLVSAFTWLKSKDVDVISNSWGSYKVPDPIVAVVKDIIKTGRGGKGTPVVFAVGDDSKNLDDVGIDDESEIEGVISVAASTPYDNRYTRSNYGKNLTLVAPGVDLIVAREDEAKIQTNFAGGANGTDKQLYVKETGTSFSAPIVAAGIALMIHANKDITADAIMNILQNTSDKIATNRYSYDVQGRNNYYGYGRINLEDAVRASSVWSSSSSLGRGNSTFTLDIQRGWNLLSIPVQTAIYQKDFEKYFGLGHRLITLEDGAYNHYVKAVFPQDGFYLYSLSATKIDFTGEDYNTSFDSAPIIEGWNLLGVGEDTNVSTVRNAIENTDYIYLYRDSVFKTGTNDDNISRGEGFFLYKLNP